MHPRLRKFLFTAHVTLSVGWLGAVLAYLAVAVASLRSDEYIDTLELIGWYVIVPLSLTALAAGLVQSLGTEWGLFRHYWIVVKFTLAVVAATILLLHMRVVSHLADHPYQPGSDSRLERMQLVIHAAGGLLVLLTTTVLSIYKPWGLTRYGLRVQSERRTGGAITARLTGKEVGLLIALLALLVLLALLHLGGGGFPGH